MHKEAKWKNYKKEEKEGVVCEKYLYISEKIEEKIQLRYLKKSSLPIIHFFNVDYDFTRTVQ